jgi:hypothetical protein
MVNFEERTASECERPQACTFRNRIRCFIICQFHTANEDSRKQIALDARQRKSLEPLLQCTGDFALLTLHWTKDKDFRNGNSLC